MQQMSPLSPRNHLKVLKLHVASESSSPISTIMDWKHQSSGFRISGRKILNVDQPAQVAQISHKPKPIFWKPNNMLKSPKTQLTNKLVTEKPN